MVRVRFRRFQGRRKARNAAVPISAHLLLAPTVRLELEEAKQLLPIVFEQTRHIRPGMANRSARSHPGFS